MRLIVHGSCYLLEANAFSESIYQLDWYNFSIEEKKMLLLMYMQSQEAVSIKAGHLYKLNFPILTQVRERKVNGNCWVTFQLPFVYSRLSSFRRPFMLF